MENGGYLIASFRSGFADESLKVAHDVQPHILHEALGVIYHEFTYPEKTGLTGPAAETGRNEEARLFMELLIPEGAKVLASYDHPAWKQYAAVTENTCGKGKAVYIGCGTSDELLAGLYRRAASETGIPLCSSQFPVIVRGGVNDFGRNITYLMNFSGSERTAAAPYDGTLLLSGRMVKQGDSVVLAPWGVEIAESVS